jgi:signal transduction histidine kinase
MSQEKLGLFDTPPTRKQTRFCVAIVVFLFALSVAILPFRNVPLGRVDAFIPVVNAVMAFGEVVTAILLFSQAVIFRSRALAILAASYIFVAVLLVSHALTFPGAFAPDGLLSAGLNSTSWLAQVRRVAVTIGILLYVYLKNADLADRSRLERHPPAIMPHVIVATALGVAATAVTIAAQDVLPQFYWNQSARIQSQAVPIELVVFSLFAVATVALFRKRSSVLDLWLLTSLGCWLIQSLLIMTLEARFTAGFYHLYVLILFAHLVVMFALIAESNRLYVRLALSTSERHRERTSRAVSMDAVAAIFSQEIGQPIAAAATAARASLNWLNRPRPEPEMAIESVQATLDAGHQAFEVLKGIRSKFAKVPGSRSEIDLNALVREALAVLDRELAARKISLTLSLDEALPPVRGNEAQLRQVLVSLIAHSAGLVSATQRPERRIFVRSVTDDGQDVRLEVIGNGIAMSPEGAESLFDAFVDGANGGLPLPLCRTIVEDHGGRLWARVGQSPGATFHLLLPRRLAPYRHDVEAAEMR